MNGHHMNVRGLTLAAIVATAAAATADVQQKPAFRAHVDVVAIDVAVTVGNTPVTGLTAQDFALLDNDVPQQVELISIERLPIDVTLVVDTSGSVARHLDRVKESIRRVAAMLRADDRLRVLTFASTTSQVLALGDSVESLSVEVLRARGWTAAYDAIVQSIVRGAEPDRRHLIAAFTDGGDNQSVVAPEQFLDVARRSDSVLVVALSSGPLILSPQSARFDGPRPEQLFRQAAESTGGQLYEGTSPEAIDRTFRRIFDAYRQSYLLRYEPTGVAREGWHDISVKVVKAGSGRYTVRARKGYDGGQKQ